MNIGICMFKNNLRLVIKRSPLNSSPVVSLHQVMNYINQFKQVAFRMAFQSSYIATETIMHNYQNRNPTTLKKKNLP